MSYEAVQWAMYESPMLLTTAGKPDTVARTVLIARAERADKHGHNTYAGTADIIRVTGFDERTIERAERRLERAGLLIRAGISRHGTVLWHVDMGQKQADDNAHRVAAQLDRRRKADAIRQQRARDLRRARAGVAERGDSIEADVSNEIGVTDAESVTSRILNPDVTDAESVTSRTQRPPNHPEEPPVEPPGETTPGGTLPPGPLRPKPPTASGPWTGERNSLSEALTARPSPNLDPLPRTRADQTAAAIFPPEQMSGTRSAGPETRTDEQDP